MPPTSPRANYATKNVKPSDVVLVAVPGAKELVVVPTYAGQLLPTHRFVMKLGNSIAVAEALAFTSEAASAAEERAKQLEARIADLHTIVGPVTDNRALPFVAYMERISSAQGGSFGRIAEHVKSGAYTEQDVSQLIGMVYPNLARGVSRKLKGVRLEETEIRKALKDYIVRGELSQYLFELLKGVVDARFNAVPEYNNLTAELAGINPASAVSGLEAAIDSFKLGNALGTVNVFGQEFDLAEALQAVLGVKPESCMLITADTDVQAKIDAGLLDMLRYRASDGARGIPEEVRPFYKPVVWLGRIITLFDITLRNMLIIYAQENQELHGLLHDVLSRRKQTFNYGLFMRALFPEGHKPILTLYPDERVLVKGEEGIAEKAVKLVQNGRTEILGIVSKQLGIPEGQIRFEELIELQAQIMHILPMPLYVCADMSRRMELGIVKTRNNRRRLTPLERMLLTRYEESERSLQRDFATDPLSAVTLSNEVADGAIKFFGEEFGFVRQVSRISERPAIRVIGPAKHHAHRAHWKNA